jgi:predicted MFS family arabinose efflux permease
MSFYLGVATDEAAPHSQSPRALTAMGIGGFLAGTGESNIMGLLPEVARDVGIGIPPLAT